MIGLIAREVIRPWETRHTGKTQLTEISRIKVIWGETRMGMMGTVTNTVRNVSAKCDQEFVDRSKFFGSANIERD